MDTSFRYGQNRRDYFDSTGDYRSWFLENKTDYAIFNSKLSSLGSSLKSEHQEADYPLDDSSNYIKDSLKIELIYRKKKSYGIAPSFTFTQYNYPADLNRKEKDYLTGIEFIKEFVQPDLKLSLKYSCKFRDFRYKADALQWLVNLGMELVF